MSATGARSAVAAQLEELTAPGGALFGGGRDTAKLPVNYTWAGYPTRVRRQLRRRVIDEYLSLQTGVPREGAAALLTAGPPGAGKTTALDRLGSAVSGWRRLDADLVKEYLIIDAVASGYYDDLLGLDLADGQPIMPAELASATHIESLSILQDIRDECLRRGENIIIEGTLGWAPHGAQLLGELLATGYRQLDIVDVEVTAGIAREQVLRRWWACRQKRIATGSGLGGRYVPAAVIDRLFPDPAEPHSICAEIARALFESDAAADLASVTLAVHDSTSGSVVSHTSRRQRE